MMSTVIGGAMLPHAPQFFTMPDTEDKKNVEHVREVAADVGKKLRALRKRDGRAARAVVRKHFQSLGLMLEFVSRTRRKPAQVLSLVPRPRGAVR